MQGSETAIIQASYACDRGSSPLPAPMRMYVNGRLSALQADDAGSIPVVRSIDKNARASDRFLAHESSFFKNRMVLRSKHGICLQAACLERIDYSPPNAELAQRQNLSLGS